MLCFHQKRFPAVITRTRWRYSQVRNHAFVAQSTHTFESLVPFLYSLYGFVELWSLFSSRLLRPQLFAGRNHPWVPEKLFSRDTQIVVFLEAMVKEVLHDLREKTEQDANGSPS